MRPCLNSSAEAVEFALKVVLTFAEPIGPWQIEVSWVQREGDPAHDVAGYTDYAFNEKFVRRRRVDRHDVGAFDNGP